MRLITTLSILIISSLGLSGCGGDYQAERLMWEARQESRFIQGDPKLVPAEAWENVVQAYQKVLDKAPGSKLAAQAQFNIATVYLRQLDLEKAREAYGKVLQNYSKDRRLSSEAYFIIGRTHELENHWDKAVESYENLVLYYGDTLKGLQVPIYIAEGYKRRGQIEEARAAYEKALKGYDKRAEDSSSGNFKAHAYGFKAWAYESEGDWANALNTHMSVANEYPESDRAPLSLFTAALIYQQKFQDMDRAVQLYKTLLSRYPKHRLTQFAILQVRSYEEQGALKDLSVSPADVDSTRNLEMKTTDENPGS
ncbi:MAG: tetratricopeptide repeat protein [Candidatus Omnitrophica bacterium]|nr:tetratricopeptide repeat protein [Candidatus Omnitrophota bacterium]